MVVLEPIIRNSSTIGFCFIILLTIFSSFVLYCKSSVFNQPIEIKDPTSLFLLCLSIVSVVVIGQIVRLLLLFGYEHLRYIINESAKRQIYISKTRSSTLNQFLNHLATDGWFLITLSIEMSMIGCLIFFSSWLFVELKFNWDYFYVICSSGMLVSSFHLLNCYDDVDLNSSQNIEKSVGAAMAHGAYSAYYKRILEDITRRMTLFEEKQGISLLVKKLVIICPLSCNANGSLEGKDGEMEFSGYLEEIIVDEGASTGRNFKTNVYKIRGSETYIAAEIPSPLSALYETRHVFDPVIFQYHRNCFIHTFKELLKSYPCIILEYDDLNSSQPLHVFLLSQLRNGEAN